jgi:hypothetical protein
MNKRERIASQCAGLWENHGEDRRPGNRRIDDTAARLDHIPCGKGCRRMAGNNHCFLAKDRPDSCHWKLRVPPHRKDTATILLFEHNIKDSFNSRRESIEHFPHGFLCGLRIATFDLRGHSQMRCDLFAQSRFGPSGQCVMPKTQGARVKHRHNPLKVKIVRGLGDCLVKGSVHLNKLTEIRCLDDLLDPLVSISDGGHLLRRRGLGGKGRGPALEVNTQLEDLLQLPYAYIRDHAAKPWPPFNEAL